MCIRDRWYIAGVNGRAEPRELSLRLAAWVKNGNYARTLITDGAAPRKLASERAVWNVAEPIPVKMAPFGGFLVKLQP